MTCAIATTLSIAACSEPNEDRRASGQELAAPQSERNGSLDGEGEPNADVDAFEPLPGSVATPAPVPPAPGAVLVYESVRHWNGGELLAQSEYGELSIDQETRAARPYRHTHEATLYTEETWTLFHEDESSEHGVRVWAVPNAEPAPDPMSLPDHLPGPPVVHDSVLELLEREWEADERHNVTVLLRGFPEWDAPLRPRPGIHSDERVADQEAARAAALAERAGLYESLTQDLFAGVEASGGKVVMKGEHSGWANLDVDKAGLVELTEREDLRSVAVDEGGLQPGWALGDGLDDDKVDAGDYVDAGFDGGGPSWGSRIKIAFVENGKFRHTACGFKNDAYCAGSSRIWKMYRCDRTITGPAGVTYCETVPLTADEFPNPEEGSSDGKHGTIIVSAAIADYSEGQALSMGLDFGSGNAASASGYAPEARAIYFGNINNDNGPDRVPRHAEAFVRAIGDGADIINFSQGLVQGSQRCHPAADTASELEAENAFDDGILIAACGGNFVPPSSGTETKCDTACGTFSVGSLPKTLAIVGFRSAESSCVSNFAACRKDFCMNRVGGFCLDKFSACRGGSNVKVNGSTKSQTATLTDLVMPTHISHTTTWGSTARGAIELDPNQSGGCSTATPQLAGLAASVKDYHLQAFDLWITYPGRLHGVMLTMGDRRYSPWDEDGGAITQGWSGASRTWGLGRVRARYWNASNLAPAALWTNTYTFSSSSGPAMHNAFGNSPLPSGVALAKCTMLVMEDMSGESMPVSISDVRLTMEVRSPIAGVCIPGSGNLYATVSDTRFDWKKMVARASSQTSLAGRCVTIIRDAVHVETGGVTTQLTCAYTGAQEL